MTLTDTARHQVYAAHSLLVWAIGIRHREPHETDDGVFELYLPAWLLHWIPDLPERMDKRLREDAPPVVYITKDKGSE